MKRSGLRRMLGLVAGMGLAVWMAVPPVAAQTDYRRFFDEDNLPGMRLVFLRGDYDMVLRVCHYAIQRGQPSWEWRVLLFEALSAKGAYEEALQHAKDTVAAHPAQLGVLLRAHELFRQAGRKEDADAARSAINDVAAALPTSGRTSEDLFYLGQAALLLGADPATVERQYWDLAKREGEQEPVPYGVVEAWLASGELALSKDDYEKAARDFQAADRLAPEDIRVLHGLARAFQPGDAQAADRYWDRILETAPVHFGALLNKAETAINVEQYEMAHEWLDRVLEVNERHPEAFAYKAVLAEMERGDRAAFEQARGRALSVWKNNPRVDYLIGRVLSRKYRHEEGAECQKRALEMDPDFVPAQLQLALDCLRLGRMDEAWALAREAGQKDPYNILAYNLEVLEKEFRSFAAVSSPHFHLRLPEMEAAIYGQRALELLTEAREVLGDKYGIRLDQPTLVEFYPNQQDFAIRSFGALGGAGMLGVCFGSVITMNSPGSIASGRNHWESTLWHEYCHVVTLTATRNRMPRWLSEGISVYEEKQKNPLWGQHMTPEYRKRIVEKQALTPIANMSRAFFLARSGEDIMFAYYQSMLVVEYLMEHHGLEAMKHILADLAGGTPMNEALAQRIGPMEVLQEKFTAWALDQARRFGSDLDWSEPAPEEVNPLEEAALLAYLQEHPKNFWAQTRLAMRWLELENWEEAAAAADKLIQWLPEHTGPGNGYAMKARALRAMDDPAGEEQVLSLLADRSSDAVQAYHRLLETGMERQDWDVVLLQARNSLAINPFYERAHYGKGCALEAAQRPAEAAGAFEKALLLEPPGAAELRFRLARLLRSTQPERAKRHLLDALSEAPRLREGHELLLEFRSTGQ